MNRALTEVLQWNTTELPDAEITVLLNMPDADDPVWLGYWCGDLWMLIDGFPAPAPVYAWAEMPRGAA